MKKNTVKIGDELEDKALQVFHKLVADQIILGQEDLIRVFRKKKYKTAARPRGIEFDLTVEIWPPGADRYVMLYVIECKNYKTRLPASQLHELDSKLNQLQVYNIKGIVVTNSMLRKGALEIAESKGLMVVLMQPNGSQEYRLIMYKRSLIKENEIPYFRQKNETMISEGVNLLAKNVDNAILKTLETIEGQDDLSENIPKLSKDDIEVITNSELNAIDHRILGKLEPLTPQMLKKYIKDQFSVEIKIFESKDQTLGYCDVGLGVIGINASIVDTNREMFVLGHEIGHLTLHSSLRISQNQYDRFQDSQYNFGTGKRDLTNPKNWIEWQANHFAATLTLPTIPLIASLIRIADIREGQPLYVDDQKSNQIEFQQVLGRLASTFHTSKTSIYYRLNGLNMIKDERRLKSIGDLLFEYKDNWVPES